MEGKVKKKLGVVIFGLIFAISAVSAYLFLNSENDGLPEVSGIVEATEVEISSKLGSRIAWLGCEEGERVKSNDVAIRLDDAELKAIRAEAVAAIRQAESAVLAAKGGIEGAKAGTVTSKASLKEVEAEIK